MNDATIQKSWVGVGKMTNMRCTVYPLIGTPLIVTLCDFLSKFRKNTTENSTKPETTLLLLRFFNFL